MKQTAAALQGAVTTGMRQTLLQKVMPVPKQRRVPHSWIKQGLQ